MRRVAKRDHRTTGRLPGNFKRGRAMGDWNNSNEGGKSRKFKGGPMAASEFASLPGEAKLHTSAGGKYMGKTGSSSPQQRGDSMGDKESERVNKLGSNRF